MIGVSCICPTFGRWELLEEAIESFLRQDYGGAAELVILNDADWQELVFRHERVYVFNRSERCNDMGSKWNELVCLSAHDCFIPWPDDDIMLPWAIRSFVELLGQNEYVHPHGRWVASSKGVKEHTPRGAQGIIAFTRQAWREAGGYPEMYSGQDTAFLRRLRNLYGRHQPKVSIADTFFIYRWWGIPFHLSRNTTKELWDGLGDRIRATTVHGRIELKPRWGRDYVSETRSLIA